MMKKIVLLIFLVVLPIALLAMADNYFSVRSSAYLEQAIQKKLTDVVTNSILEPTQKYMGNQRLVTYIKDENNTIKSVYINSDITNQILIETNQAIGKLLDQGIVEESITHIELPLGLLLFKSLFTTVGPSIPIRVLPVTAYKSDICTKSKSLGINNMLLEIYLKIEIHVDTIIPLKKEQVDYVTHILLASQVVQGEIPYYYYSGNGTIEALPQYKMKICNKF